MTFILGILQRNIKSEHPEFSTDQRVSLGVCRQSTPENLLAHPPAHSRKKFTLWISTGDPQDIHDGLLLGIAGKRKKITCVKLSGCVSDATLATWARDALAVAEPLLQKTANQ